MQNPVEYFNLFNSNLRYRVDASHVYFSSPETPGILFDLFPQARFLVILRDPKARAHSLYQHMRRALHRDGRPMELIDSFLKALSVEGERFTSAEFASECRQYFWNFMYMRSSYFDLQLSRYFAVFPNQRFMITTLAELHHRPKSTLKEIAQFLDLDVADFDQKVPIANAAPLYPKFDSECDMLMERHFEGLVARVEAIVGRSLDWSL